VSSPQDVICFGYSYPMLSGISAAIHHTCTPSKVASSVLVWAFETDKQTLVCSHRRMRINIIVKDRTFMCDSVHCRVRLSSSSCVCAHNRTQTLSSSSCVSQFIFLFDSVHLHVCVRIAGPDTQFFFVCASVHFRLRLSSSSCVCAHNRTQTLSSS